MKVALAQLLICLCVALGPVAWAGRTSPVPASVSFWNRPGDGIKSDGDVYTNGVAKVECAMQIQQTRKDLLLNLARTRGGRWIQYKGGNPLNNFCGLGLLVLNSWYSDGGDFKIHGLGNMLPGETRALRANLLISNGYKFDFVDGYAPSPVVPYACSTNVVAYRQTGKNVGVWLVATNYFDLSPFGASVADWTTDGQPLIWDGALYEGAPQSNLVTPGDITQLDAVVGNTGYQFTGNNYRMPFGLTVSCPTCP